MMVENEIAVALIAAGASFVIAIISLIASMINTRSCNKSSHSLELLKKELSLSKAIRDLTNEEKKKELEALKDAVRAIQQLKDGIRLVQMSTPESLGKAAALSRIGVCREVIFESYKDMLPDIKNQNDAKAFHDAKNMSVDTERALGRLLADMSNFSEINAEIAQIHSHLSDIQGILRDSHTEKLVELLGFSANEIS